MALAADAGLEPTDREYLETHTHAHLDVFVDGVQIAVPSGIGIDIAAPAGVSTEATDDGTGNPDFALTDEMGRPFDQIAGGMDGVGRSNPNTPEWVLLQTLTAEQGLAAVTTGAAYALNDEAHRGHLAPGTYADITILSGDATAGTPDEIRDLQIIATIVGGVTEFCADPAMCP